jgi:pimeloyl-ACP methyl ester carboxylesterase
MAVPPLWAAGLRFLHPKQLRRSWYMAFFQLDRAEAALCRDEFALIDRLWRDWSPGYRCPPAELAAIKAALAGAPAAVLGYYRAFRRWKLGAGLLFERPRVPGLYLHGRDDGCIGAELMGSLSSASIAGFQAELLDDAGHFLHLEQPDKVNALLVAFMSRYRE